MLCKLIDLKVQKKKEYYELIATIGKEDGETMVLTSKVSQPWLQVNTTQDTEYTSTPTGAIFRHICLNKSASFHFNADAIVDTRNQTLFSLSLGKKEKKYIPKKHRKRDKKSSKR